jgi:hypothetical protein
MALPVWRGRIEGDGRHAGDSTRTLGFVIVPRGGKQSASDPKRIRSFLCVDVLGAQRRGAHV